MALMARQTLLKFKLRAPSPVKAYIGNRAYALLSTCMAKGTPVNSTASSTSLCSIDPGTDVATRTSGIWSAKHEGATRAHPDN